MSVGICSTPVIEGRERVSMRDFCEHLQNKLENYWIEFSEQLEEARDEYEIVDDEGNSIDHQVEWNEFDACPFIEVSYRGTLLPTEQKVVKDFRESVQSQKRWVNSFWRDIQNKDEPLQRSGGDVFPKSFGHHLSFIIFSAKELEQKEKEALKKINSLEGLSEEYKKTLVQEIYDLSLNAKKFIEEGEEK